MCPLCRLALALLLAAPPSELHPSLEEKKKIHTRMCEYIHAYTAYTRRVVDVCWCYLRARPSLSRSLALSRARALSLAFARALSFQLSLAPSSPHTHTKNITRRIFFLFFWDTVELSEGASESVSLLRHFFLDSAAGGFEFL
jgi:hypothetical protein